ncbi:hypothetical protein [Flavobacterium muglaense]|uniref:Uncharacterized protein n=1 Tax=Flavobacterium muglaense TaxID=2764716 RepID=A0A923SIJ3_9FLAO|nr:hypothetical protein [Flavobacterium muglaense]MBC5836692.1 hypothetical protein [Flavobacterium muglaense]MBC5843358.1 hypothetical protein [Flavobacterium muglaense]
MRILFQQALNYYKLKSNNVKHKFYGVSQSINVVDGIKENLEIRGANLLIITGGAGTKVGKNAQNILEKVRRTPVLIIRPPAFAFEKLYLTIVSDFRQKLNTIDLDNFCKVLENTNFEVKILVLEIQNEITIQATNNLEALIIYLKPFLKQVLTIEYTKLSYDFKDYIASHLDGIICVVDEKPDLFRKIGLSKSNLISKLENSYSNPVLVVHQ